jgi:hypothetical protein
MKNVLLVLVAMLAAISFAACGGDDDAGEADAAPAAAAAAKVAPAAKQAAAPIEAAAEDEDMDEDEDMAEDEDMTEDEDMDEDGHEGGDEPEDDDTDRSSSSDFDYDRFLDETVGNTPRGIVMSMDISGAGEELGIGGMSMEMSFSTEPVVASSIVIGIQAGDVESELHVITIEEELYFNTILDGEETGWMVTVPDEASDDLLGGFGDADVSEIFSEAEFDREEWIPAGEAACRDRECYVLEHATDEGRKMLVDKDTYIPVQLIQLDENPDGQPIEIVIEILVWNDDVEIEAPDDAVEAAPEDLMGAFFGLIMSASGGLGG